jgi:elongator complex protein 1
MSTIEQSELDRLLAWRPSGALLAAGLTRRDHTIVAFIEKNGLQHGELALQPATEGELLELAWSCDGQVLLVWLQLPAVAGHLLQLWMVGNHHWYLKQQLVEAGEVVGPVWSQQHPGMLRYIVRSSGEEVLKTVKLAWSTDCGGELATVAVVDGATVGLTRWARRWCRRLPPPSSSGWTGPSGRWCSPAPGRGRVCWPGPPRMATACWW